MKECDLVMKGGITSGIVYPPVVQILRKTYRFKNIGGTSAGAIAAALTAAAECGRDKGGFEELKKVQEELGKERFIFNLFKATPEGQPILDAGSKFLEGKREAEKDLPEDAKGKKPPLPFWNVLRVADRAIVKSFRDAARRGGLMGAAVGFFATALLAVLFVTPMLIEAGRSGANDRFGPLGWVVGAPIVVLMLAVVGIGVFVGRRVGPVVQLVKYFWRELPAANYGIVQGSTGKVDDTSALTDYLSAKINRLANKGPKECLTFSHLDPGGKGEGVVLKCVTTNVSHGRPYVLPFDDNELFFFKIDEFEKLFPDYVVAHMKSRPGPAGGTLAPPKGYLRVPKSADLPVVVAMRMSLSFPVLIAAVPLYTVKRSALSRKKPEEGPLQLVADDLQRNWFSDGGICSNFPIHFFDAFLPARPTFGINLTYRSEDAFEKDGRTIKPEFQSVAFRNPAKKAKVGVSGGVDDAEEFDEAAEEGDELAAEGDDLARPVARPEAQSAAQGKGGGPDNEPEPKLDSVWLPKANDFLASDPEWKDVQKLTAFIGGIFSAAQNYRDNLQAGLPSYRERIVRINLTPNEGGMNLDMPPEIVKGIVGKGERAGKALMGFDFDDHLWTRYLVLMAELERHALKGPDGVKRTDGKIDEWITDFDNRPPSYRRTEGWMKRSRLRLQLLHDFLAKWHEMPPAGFPGFQARQPKPESMLRITPKV